MSKINWADQKNVNLLRTEVKNSPDNLTVAFKNAAMKLGTTAGAVTNAWYTVVKHKINGFQTKSSKVKYVNIKNVPRKITTGNAIYEKVINVKQLDGLRVVTVVKYFPN